MMTKNLHCRGWLLVFSPCLFTVGSILCAQQRLALPDTVAISIAEAEKRFVKNNLQLLAARFNIEASHAAILQAGLWSNPNIAIEQNVFNQTTKRYFDFTRTGNTEIALQQLILLAGKRDKQIRLASINKEIADNTFYDLLRSLKLELRTDLYDLHFFQQSLHFYNQTVPEVRKTVQATEKNYESRAILLSELLRLKSLLFSLENERLAVLSKITGVQSDLHILLRDTALVASYYVPQMDGQALDELSLDSLSLPPLVALALNNRPDYHTAHAAVTYEETNLALQKAMGVPDLTLGGRWSRAGSYIPEYFAVSVAIDLPLFNRNQGNIQVSEKTLETNKLLRERARESISREVITSYRKAVDIDRLYKSFSGKFTDQYATLVQGMLANYEHRNITIIEFTDFYEAYRTSMLQMNQIQNDRIDAIENLNFVTGSTLFTPGYLQGGPDDGAQ